MAYLGVSHLSVRETNMVLGGIKPRMREAREKRIPNRRLRLGYCVVLALGADTPTVENA